MEIELALRGAGLAGNEIKVYLALLDLGSALAGEITKKSGVNRTNVYDALDRLIEKGMASYVVQANRKYFEATDPERILQYLDEMQSEIGKKKRLISSVLPDLEVKRKLGKEPLEATVYKGKRGLKSVAEDSLKQNKEMLIFGAEGNFMELMKHYGENWHRRRTKLKIPIRIIYNEKIRKKKLKAGFKITKMRFSSMLYDTPSTTWIYGDKTAVIVWSDQPVITLIRSKEVAKSYNQFFNVLWKESRD